MLGDVRRNQLALAGQVDGRIVVEQAGDLLDLEASSVVEKC